MVWRPFEIGLVAYLILAPVYWLPGVGMDTMAAGKLALFTAVVGLSILRMTSIKHAGILVRDVVMWIVILAFAAIPGVVQTSGRDLFSFIFDFGTVGTALLIGFVLINSGGPVRSYLAVYVCGLAILSLLSIFVSNPLVVRDIDGVVTAAGGFAPGRTGWSNGIAFASVISLILMLSARTNIERLFFFSAFLGIATSQLYFGGRSGFVAPLIAFGVYVFFLSKSTTSVRLLWAIAIIGASFLTWLLFAQQVESAFRLDRSATVVYGSQWDAILSGRVSNWELAYQLISQHPFIGYGFGDWSASGNWGKYFVHNEWLKFTYQGGAIYAFTWGAFVLYLFFMARRADRFAALSRNLAPVFTAVLFTGIAITFSEPNTLIGVFQKSAPLWVVLGGAFAQQHLSRVRGEGSFRGAGRPLAQK